MFFGKGKAKATSKEVGRTWLLVALGRGNATYLEAIDWLLAEGLRLPTMREAIEAIDCSREAKKIFNCRTFWVAGERITSVLKGTTWQYYTASPDGRTLVPLDGLAPNNLKLSFNTGYYPLRLSLIGDQAGIRAYEHYSVPVDYIVGIPATSVDCEELALARAGTEVI